MMTRSGLRTNAIAEFTRSTATHGCEDDSFGIEIHFDRVPNTPKFFNDVMVLQGICAQETGPERIAPSSNGVRAPPDVYGKRYFTSSSQTRESFLALHSFRALISPIG